MFSGNSFRSKCVSKWRLDFRYDLHFSHNTTKQGGLLIGFKRSLDYKVHKKIIEKDYMLMRISIGQEEYTIVNVYREPVYNAEHVSELFQRVWGQIVKNSNLKIIIAGDLNATLSEMDINVNTYYRQRVSVPFQQFVNESGMVDVWRMFNPTEQRFTRTATHGQQPSRIDYFLVSDLMLNYTCDTSIGLAFQSDHTPLYYTFYSNRNTPGHQIFRFPTFLCSDSDFVKQLSQSIELFVRDNVLSVPQHEQPSPSLLWDCLKAHIRGHTISYLQY